MNKRMLCLAALCASCACEALELRMNDGTVLENVSVEAVDGKEWTIAAYLPDGTFTIRQVRLAELTPASRRALELNSESGLREAWRPEWALSGPASAEGMLPPLNNGWSEQVSPNAPIVLPGFPSTIVLRSEAVLLNGTLGFANAFSPTQAIAEQYYGMIYVYGIQLPQAAVWNGNVYPTRRRIWHNGNQYPCFATNPATAAAIDRIAPAQ